MASNTLKKLKYDNKDIQVESAVRDGAGQNIEATYATKDAVKFAPHYPTMTGTAAVTSGTTQCAKWNATDTSITELYNGLCLHVKIPVAGNGTYFVGLSVNGGDYHPVVFNVNSTISTRYSVNSTIELIYNSTQTGNIYLNGTNTTVTGVWQAMDYDSNTTTTYGTLSYYLRPYVGTNRLTAYKLVAFDKDNRIIPITTEQYLGTYSTSTTYLLGDIVVSSSKYYRSKYNGSNKNKAVTNTTYWEQITMPSTFTPNTTPFKPNKIYFYNTTAGVAAGTVIGGQTLTNVGYNTSVCSYTFWATIASYRMIYLQGTYNRTTGLFTLDTGANFYKLVPDNTANLTLSSYFTSGKDYILVGSTYSSNNYLQLFEVNTMYHFDGTNLVPYDTYNANRIEEAMPTDTNDLTNGAGFISGITSSDVINALGYTPYSNANPNGYTSNVGTVTKVNNVSPVNGNVTLTIPAAVTESTVSGWGFTKNAGTITGVSVNGTSVATSGTAALTDIAKTNVSNTFTTEQTFQVNINVGNSSTGDNGRIWLYDLTNGDYSDIYSDDCKFYFEDINGDFINFDTQNATIYSSVQNKTYSFPAQSGTLLAAPNPSTNKDKYLHTNSSTGELEWTTVSGGGGGGGSAGLYEHNILITDDDDEVYLYFKIYNSDITEINTIPKLGNYLKLGTTNYKGLIIARAMYYQTQYIFLTVKEDNSQLLFGRTIDPFSGYVFHVGTFTDTVTQL